MRTFLAILIGLFGLPFVIVAAAGGWCPGIGVGLIVLMIVCAVLPPPRCDLCGQRTEEKLLQRQEVEGKRMRICPFCAMALRQLRSKQAVLHLFLDLD